MIFSKNIALFYIAYFLYFRFDMVLSPSTDEQLGYYIDDGYSELNAEIFSKAKNKNHLSPSETADYHYGLGHYPKAFSWYYQAAKKNDGYSQNRVGEMYQYGRGVHQDYTEAMAWYMKAHNNGILPATHNIGSLHCDGLGVKQNYQIGLKWYLEAANEGYDISQYSMGMHYEYGVGVQANILHALEWYQKAAIQGHPGAKYNVRRLNSEGFYLSNLQKLNIRSEQLKREQKNKDTLKEKLKLTEQQHLDVETEKKHIDLKIKSLVEEVDILAQKNLGDKKIRPRSNLEKTHSN